MWVKCGRVQLIGDKIARNGGVVTAEELAPFLDMKINARSYSPGDDMDESFVLPVLQRLQGTPQVDKVLCQLRCEEATGCYSVRIRVIALQL